MHDDNAKGDNVMVVPEGTVNGTSSMEIDSTLCSSSRDLASHLCSSLGAVG